MRLLYLAPQLSHRMVPSKCSTSMMHPQDSDLPQKGQSKTVATLGFAFFGGGFALFRLPLQ